MKDQQKCVVKKKNYVPLVFSSQVCTIQDSIFEETLLEALTNSQDKTRKGVFTSNQVTSRYGMKISVTNSQCGSLEIFLRLIFYVASNLASLGSQNVAILPFLASQNFQIL